jgi:hypothetical protein
MIVFSVEFVYHYKIHQLNLPAFDPAKKWRYYGTIIYTGQKIFYQGNMDTINDHCTFSPYHGYHPSYNQHSEW